MVGIPIAPYIISIIFFIVTYILITDPVFSYIVLMSKNTTWAKLTVALLIGALTFISIGWALMNDDHEEAILQN